MGRLTNASTAAGGAHRVRSIPSRTAAAAARRARALAAAIAAVVIAPLIVASPAAAITNGTVDGDDHPYVALYVARDAAGTARMVCSASLISPRIAITAAHCMPAGIVRATLVFSADPIVCGCDALAVHGTPYPHPLANPTNLSAPDVGVVVLDGDGYDPGRFGILPGLRALDELRIGRRTTFTAVGFGRQDAFPEAASWKNEWVRQRMVSYPWLVQINSSAVGSALMLISNATEGGGTCKGDSGGPTLLGSTDVIAAVTTFGLSPLCDGVGGVHRLDTDIVHDWLEAAFGDLY